MKVSVCDGITLTNPIGDSRDYHAGDVLELPDGRAALWIKRGWVREYGEPEPASRGGRRGSSPYR